MPQCLPARISLIGFMGSGKSTVGRLLAERIGYRFLDLDEIIESEAGKPVREIFATYGEEDFRRQETKELYSLTGRDKLVVATGGGAPIRMENRAFFKDESLTVYLEVSFKEFLKRTGSDEARPLLKLPPKKLKALYEKRLSVYRALGRLIMTGCKSPENITEEIISLLGAGC
ncbi:MAG: shikimate kinase [Planctomycetes bacterium]|nr:shikimate kinase [Planctomycetota bacterium]